MGKTSIKITARAKRIKRIRKKITGTSAVPRLRVFKSACHIYAQLIDDTIGCTVVSMSSLDKSIIENNVLKGKTGKAFEVGKILAEKARAHGIEKAVFDRGGYIYHGRVKAVSEGARDGGLLI